ncbi:molybdopterin molybdotransferase MoeA [Cumulibacter manganitolerans]|uniref:molybdopterin molybdotransferase MoeA n=1 Tax=Cumulibacter manganitolerans TaxID=1884992 RepID=UPI001E3E4B4A|nr:gephyrin-like molybdotransferase Glp [Cumulibacter manganitolerans]
MPSALISVDEYAARVRDLLGVARPTDVPLADADALVLADDLVARVALPTFDNSAMDGYAVRHADLAADGPTTLPVSADIPAGATEVAPLAPGSAARIMTGAPVPDGADTVVPVELTDAAQTGAAPAQVTVAERVAAGKHVRPKGEEAAAGDVLLTAGTTLTPAALGLAAAVGHATVLAYPRPRVLVLSTGSELVRPGEELLPGQIYESNSVQLVAALTRIGARARALNLVEDDVAAFHARLRDEAAGADLIITSGGVSAGAYEVVKDALGGSVEFVKTAMQPGMPQGCGLFESTPIITLPGNPVSVFVSFEVYVRPALLAWMGVADTERPGFVGTWAGAAQGSPVGKRQFLRGECDVPSGSVTPVGTPPSHMLASLARANSLVVIPEDVDSVNPGDEVEIWLLDPAL